MFNRLDRIKPEQLRIEKITPSHKKFLETFSSYEEELVDFLNEDALEQQNRKISVIYLWFLRETNQLVAYLTLCPDCVKLKGIDQDLSKKFREKGINYKSLPALKIGRICVEDNFLRKGVGKLMIQFSFKLAHGMSKNVGCRFVYLDAKRNEDTSKDSIHFYKKLGFQIYKDRNKRETPMYMDLFPIIQELGDN